MSRQSKDKVKVLYIDCENSRMVVEFETYTLYNIDRIDPSAIKHDWYITSMAWGWLDNKTKRVSGINAISTFDNPKKFKKNFRDDSDIVKKAHELISKADLIVGHNSDAFDIKKLNYRFVKLGLPALDMPPTVDTLKAARKYLKSSSNSLYFLAKELGVPMKIDLPKGVMHKADQGDLASLKKLKAYNKGDIKSGAGVYFKLLPFIKNHPDMNRVLNKDSGSCPVCGSKRIISNGTRKTKTGSYTRYLCKDCGSSHKGEKV